VSNPAQTKVLLSIGAVDHIILHVRAGQRVRQRRKHANHGATAQ
jgi:hypothetical protein